MTEGATGSGARRIFGSTILLSAGQGVGLVSMAVWTLVVARYIGAELYGFYAFAQAVVSVLVIFVSMGLDQLATRDVAQHPDHGRWYLWTFSAAKAAVAVVILGGFALVMTRDASATEVTVVLVVSAMGAVQAVNSLLMSLLYAYEAMHLFVAGQSANYVFTMVSGIVAVSLGRSFGAVLVLSMVASLLQLGLTLAFVRRRMPRGEPAEVPPRFLGLFRRSFPFAAVALVSVLHSNMLIILLRAASYSDRELGRFAAAQRLAMVILIVPSMVAQVLVPAFSRAVATDQDRFKGMFERAYRYVFFVSLPVAVGLAVAAPGLLDLAFGDEYAGAGETLRILALVLLGAATYVLGPALIAMDSQGLVARVHGANLLAVGALALLLIPRFGAEGAAWAMVAGTVASLIVYSRILFARLSLRFPAGWVGKSVAASIVTAAACLAIEDAVHFSVVLFVVTPVVYLGASAALRTLGSEDLAYVRGIVAVRRTGG